MDGFFSAGNYYGFIDIGIYLCYAGTVSGLILGILFPVYFLIQDPKQAKTTLYGLAGAAVLFGISYALSGGEVYEKYTELGVETGTQSKLIGASLILLYITGIIAVALGLVTELIGIFRK